jgi:two-component system chemotaxis response regulator CheY
MTARRVLSVGQCFADHGSISRTLERAFPAQVVRCDTAAEALDRLRGEAFDLVLVNRVFDADRGSGLDLIRHIKADADLRDVHVMLVSNYEDAQEEAVAAGAVPGFGKAALGQPHMLGRVRPFLEATGPDAARPRNQATGS